MCIRDRIYSICLKSVGNPFDAEDLTQEVFLSAYKSLAHFDGLYAVSYTHLLHNPSYAILFNLGFCI